MSRKHRTRGIARRRGTCIGSLYARRLHVESLEDRRMLAVFMVDNLDNSGTGSLRAAIDLANGMPGSDEIQFSIVGTIELNSGELKITEDLTITGPGQQLLTIDAQQKSRVINFSDTNGDLTLSGLTLTGGGPTGNTTSIGSGIYFSSRGTLLLTESTVRGNHAGFRGGGIYGGNSAAITLVASTLSGNYTTGLFADGGGISAGYGSVIRLISSTVSENHTEGTRAYGGGISVFHGEVLLTDSIVAGNYTVGSDAPGGGIYVIDGDIVLTDSIVHGNHTEGDNSEGGGINAKFRDITLTSSTVSGNYTLGEQSNGGGISADSGNITLMASSVSGNHTQGGFAEGGGIYNFVGDIRLTDSTVSGNHTEALFSHGGGIIFRRSTVLIENSTITGNVAGGMGGGITSFPNLSPPPMITIHNSILAGNSDNGTGPDLLAPKNPAINLIVENSLIGDNTGSSLAAAPVGMSDANGNLVGTNASPIDPKLGPLASNGGPTQTHALLPGSPALDAGDPSILFDALEFDQRGADFFRVVNDRVDIGAYEAQVAPSADFNEDGTVNGRDAMAWLRGYGKTNAVLADGNSDDDADVDASDREAWEASFGTNENSLAASTSPFVLNGSILDLALPIRSARTMELAVDVVLSLELPNDGEPISTPLPARDKAIVELTAASAANETPSTEGLTDAALEALLESAFS